MSHSSFEVIKFDKFISLVIHSHWRLIEIETEKDKWNGGKYVSISETAEIYGVCTNYNLYSSTYYPP